MSACVVGHVTVKDPGKWSEYRGRVPSTLVQWGGEVIFRGSKVKVFSGEHSHTSAVVIRFPDVGSAEGWYGSAAYQALIPLREQAAEMVLVCFES